MYPLQTELSKQNICILLTGMLNTIVGFSKNLRVFLIS